MLNQIRSEASSLGWPVRVIRRDIVPRCGPLGGISTALKTTRTDAVLFLACDMPWITAALLRTVIRRFCQTDLGLFTGSQKRVGFPFALRTEARAVVARQIERKALSLQALARVLKVKTLRPAAGQRSQLRNLNTPAEWELARRRWSPSSSRGRAQNL